MKVVQGKEVSNDDLMKAVIESMIVSAPNKFAGGLIKGADLGAPLTAGLTTVATETNGCICKGVTTGDSGCSATDVAGKGVKKAIGATPKAASDADKRAATNAIATSRQEQKFLNQE